MEVNIWLVLVVVVLGFIVSVLAAPFALIVISYILMYRDQNRHLKYLDECQKQREAK